MVVSESAKPLNRRSIVENEYDPPRRYYSSGILSRRMKSTKTFSVRTYSAFFSALGLFANWRPASATLSRHWRCNCQRFPSGKSITREISVGRPGFLSAIAKKRDEGYMKGWRAPAKVPDPKEGRNWARSEQPGSNGRDPCPRRTAEGVSDSPGPAGIGNPARVRAD